MRSTSFATGSDRSGRGLSAAYAVSTNLLFTKLLRPNYTRETHGRSASCKLRRMFPRCLHSAALSLLLLSPLHAEDPIPTPAPRSNRADPFSKQPGPPPAQKEPAPPPAGEGHGLLVVETFAVPKSLVTDILEPADGIPARYARALELMRAGKLRLVNIVATAAKTATRSTAESVDEFRFATEFEPPRAAGGASAPTTFETKPTGDTLESELTIPPGAAFPALDYNSRRTTFKGMQNFSEPPGDPAVDQPTFSTQGLTGVLSLPPGEARLVGTFSPNEPDKAEPPAEPMTWFTFARIRSQVAPEGPSAPVTGAAALVEYTFFSMDRATAEDALSDASQPDAPWQATQKLLKESKARFEHAMVLPAEQNRRAKDSESTEIRYATRFMPPKETRPWTDSTETTRTESRPRDPANANGPSGAERLSSHEMTIHYSATGKPERTPGYPGAFTTMNLGYNIEHELVLNPARTAGDLSVAISAVADLGALVYTGSAVSHPSLPLFERRALKVVALAAPGRHILVGSLNPPGANGVNGRKDGGVVWLCFARLSSVQP